MMSKMSVIVIILRRLCNNDIRNATAQVGLLVTAQKWLVGVIILSCLSLAYNICGKFKLKREFI
jgi:endonuclease V-like protein UPF0215 family